MAVSGGRRLSLVLCLLAFMSLATAAFLRPQPLPPGVAKFPSAAVADPVRSPALGRTFAFDVVGAGGKTALIGLADVPIPVRAGETIRISGWVLDSHTMRPAAQLLAGLDQSAMHPVRMYGVNRPDVVTALHDDGALTSGFQADISLAKVSVGSHSVRFATVGADGRVAELPTKVPLRVR